jgi:asparagine synthase (glutamine-hydrolysing)
MCGIAGIISKDARLVSKERLQKMTDSIQHRGPEEEGFWMNEGGNVGFGHRRLSIIDLSEAGAQPMHYLHRFTITYNGELYNYIELREDLKKYGYSFNSDCDTEVVLAAYAYYKQDCLQHFDGMFAFAIWDEQEQELFCARDRFGEKPFYFISHAEAFSFASEMKAFWATGASRELNDKMLLNYIGVGSTVSSKNAYATFYNDIFKLPRAHYLKLKFDHNIDLSYELISYWDIDKETTTKLSDHRAIDQFKDLFAASVKRRLRSDVTVGTSLSGGLDSSSIVATIKSLLPASKQKTFSAIFPRFEKDEAAQIEQVANCFKLDSFTTTPTEADLVKDFEQLIYHQEEPFQSSSINAQYKVYQLAKQHNVTVLLDGQGADEILAGYSKYYHWYWQELIAKGQWKTASQAMEDAKSLGIKTSWDLKNYAAAFLPALTARQLEKKVSKIVSDHPFIAKDFFAAASADNKIEKPTIEKLNDILYFNTMQNGLEELLKYADRNSMAHSTEVRLPFLSHELVEFIFSLPSNFKIRRGWTKWLLRTAMNEQLPQEITWRKDKVGFEPPQKQWMQNKQVGELIHEAKRKLVKEEVLTKEVLNTPIAAQSAHEEGNYDWRYLCAAAYL